MNLPAGLSPSDAFMPTLLYGLRVDAKTFRQFVDAFATYVSCNLGADVYGEVNDVLCHHDLRACGAPPPVICEPCGNGVREGSGGCGCHTSSEGRMPAALVGLGLGVAGARRRRRSSRFIAALVLVLTTSNLHGCCDPAIATQTSETSLTSESSTTSDDGASESTGESGLPGWALGVFSDQTDKVGMTIDNPLWYVWSNIEITASGAMVLNQYICSTHRQRQEFRWTLADDRQSLSLEPVPPSELFEFGSDSFISEVIVEPGASCDAIAIRYFNTDAMQWNEAEYYRGEVCAATTEPDGCTFTFGWCDGNPPAPCE